VEYAIKYHNNVLLVNCLAFIHCEVCVCMHMYSYMCIYMSIDIDTHTYIAICIRILLKFIKAVIFFRKFIH